MNLPLIVDTSVRIWTHAEQHFVVEDNTSDQNQPPEEEGHEQVLENAQLPLPHFGKVSKGRENVWDDLELMATSELNAVDSSKPLLDDTVTAALSKIRDPHHRRVIAQVDKEKANRNLLERNKRNGSSKPGPTVRTRGEPLFCDFLVQNPLSVEIQVTELQLVAKMVEDTSERVCTNLDAIRIKTPLSSTVGDDPTWSFASTEALEFSVPEFCRSSESNENKCNSAKENPFFVVTKRKLELAAGGEIVVSAGLTPLVEGNLEIIGVRCKLFDKVWVYHPFDIPGKLLQNNRTNRANRGKHDDVVVSE
jgi:hypothetical protein